MQITKVKGVKRIIDRLKAEKKRKAKGMQRGIKLAALFLMRESLLIVPVDQGILKGSWFSLPDGSGFAFKMYLGYGASYAIYVHENLDAAHGKAFNSKHADAIAAGTEKARGEDQQAKFLEQPLRDNISKLRGIIRDEIEKA